MALLWAVVLAASAVTNGSPQQVAAESRTGWPESGEMALAFEQAKIKLGVKAAAEGWRHVHTIVLGKDRVLEAWDRGSTEMTLMIWRIGAGRTGWSRGMTRKAGARADADRRKRKGR